MRTNNNGITKFLEHEMGLRHLRIKRRWSYQYFSKKEPTIRMYFLLPPCSPLLQSLCELLIEEMCSCCDRNNVDSSGYEWIGVETV
jgi:hypothetical protein